MRKSPNELQVLMADFIEDMIQWSDKDLIDLKRVLSRNMEAIDKEWIRRSSHSHSLKKELIIKMSKLPKHDFHELQFCINMLEYEYDENTTKLRKTIPANIAKHWDNTKKRGELEQQYLIVTNRNCDIDIELDCIRQMMNKR